MQRAIATAQRVVAVRHVFELLEVGQHVGPTPARVAAALPMLEVFGQATHIDHRVDRARSAQHLAARPIALAPGQCTLRFGAVHPVQRRVIERQAIADRHLHPRPEIRAPGLQQQHAQASVGAQAVGQHTARRTGTHDDVVEWRQGGGLRHTPSVPQARAAGGGPLWTMSQSTRGGSDRVLPTPIASLTPQGWPPRSRPLDGTAHADSGWGGRQSHVDMHGIKRTQDPATVGTLEKAQLGQHLHIVMNARDIACHPACRLPHRHGALTLQRVHQSPTMLAWIRCR